MVPQRIFQHLRVAQLLRLNLFLLIGLGAAPLSAQDRAVYPQEFTTVDAVVVDLRSGEHSLRAPSQEAFADALAQHGELRLTADPELRSRLANGPYSAILLQGQAALDSVALSFAARDCSTASLRAEKAILDLAAAAASGAEANQALHQAYLYRFLCADRADEFEQAMAAATMLRALDGDQRPNEISLSTWEKYPAADVQSNQRWVSVEFASTPIGADIWIDYRRVGRTPSMHLLAEGEHIVAMASASGSASQKIRVTGEGKVQLPLSKAESKWAAITKTMQELQEAHGRERSSAMGSLLAAIESEAAFVMREPGRIAVWILPINRRSAELVGHAPNATIAGRLAIEGLQDSLTMPGIDPNMPLLRESDMSETQASSDRRWWVYGIVLGAAVAGAGFVVLQDLSEDRQRIEVTLP